MKDILTFWIIVGVVILILGLFGIGGGLFGTRFPNGENEAVCSSPYCEGY